LNAIVKEAWNTSQQTDDRREKIQALSLAKDCYGMKLDLLTNATVVDDAIRFVSNHNNPALATGRIKDEGSTEEQQETEERAKEIDTSRAEEESIDQTTSTTNQTF
jgi:3-dehydroquinate dehydratase